MNRHWLIALALGLRRRHGGRRRPADRLRSRPRGRSDHAAGGVHAPGDARDAHAGDPRDAAARPERQQELGWASRASARSTPALANLNLQVNLFSWDSWVALKAANTTVAQGEANYHAAQRRPDLARRAAVFRGAGAPRTRSPRSRARCDRCRRQLEQAERRYDVGLIAVTDVQIARASRDSSDAAVIAAKRALATPKSCCAPITGEKYRSLADAGRRACRCSRPIRRARTPG